MRAHRGSMRCVRMTVLGRAVPLALIVAAIVCFHAMPDSDENPVHSANRIVREAIHAIYV
jgi:hypothetical protein